MGYDYVGTVWRCRFQGNQNWEDQISRRPARSEASNAGGRTRSERKIVCSEWRIRCGDLWWKRRKRRMRRRRRIQVWPPNTILTLTTAQTITPTLNPNQPNQLDSWKSAENRPRVCLFRGKDATLAWRTVSPSGGVITSNSEWQSWQLTVGETDRHENESIDREAETTDVTMSCRLSDFISTALISTVNLW